MTIRTPNPIWRPTDRQIDLCIVAALLFAGLWLRSAELGPSTLWYDDAWAALALRAESWSDLWSMTPTNQGFTFVLRGWFDVVGFSETRAQLLPFVAGVATGPTAFWLWRRYIGRDGATMAAGLLVVSPILIGYSTRVKPFAVEALIAVVLLTLALWISDDPRSIHRWSTLTAAAVLATVFSGALAVVVGGAFAGAGVAAIRADPRSWKTPLAFAGAYGIFAIPWALFVLLPGSVQPLRDFWRAFYIDISDGPMTALGDTWYLAGELTDGFIPASPGGWAVVVLVIAMVAVARSRPAIAALTVTPVAIALVFAVLDLAPLGGGRTDAYLYAPLALLAGAGWSLFPFDRGLRLVGAPAILVILVVVADPVPPYPFEDLRPALERLEETAEEGDAILVYPSTRWAYALYGDSEVVIHDSDSSTTGFDVTVADGDTVLLTEQWDDPDTWRMEVTEAVVEVDRVWFIGTHDRRKRRGEIEQLLRDAGFEQVAEPVEVGSAGAWLGEWRRAG